MDSKERSNIRLSDRILSALELALEQNDLEVSEILLTAIDQTLLRKTNDFNFVERRDYPPELDQALAKIQLLRAKAHKLDDD